MSLCAVAGQPDVALVVDGDAVIAVRPVVALAGPAPRLHQVAGLVVDENRRRHLAALADRSRPARRLTRSAAPGCASSSRPRASPTLMSAALKLSSTVFGPMDGPDVVLRVDRQADRRAGHPVIGQRLRPERIDFEDRRLLRAPFSREPAMRAEQRGRKQHGRTNANAPGGIGHGEAYHRTRGIGTTVLGSRFMVPGSWFQVHGSGSWFLVRGPWSTHRLCGPWTQ